jgi:hypothetical protein
MIDFTPWDTMLRTYVNDQGRVDYTRWQQEAATALDRWLATLQTSDLETLEQNSAIALLINLYNALTIRQVLQKYPIHSICPTILGLPNWLAFWWFFTKPLYTLKGQSLSLNRIEHGILRSRFAEPRIHFALVCASEGCPLLRPGAYWPEQLSSQLEADAQRFINHPQKVHYDAASQTLYCSKIFKWYQSDFRQAADSVPGYVSRYLTAAQPSANVTIAYLPYSWQLNDQRTSS